MKRYILTALVMFAFGACTVTEGEVDPINTGDTKSTITNNTADTADTGDTTGTGQILDCSDVPAGGLCENNVINFCENDVLKKLDCSTIGGNCAVADGKADCTLPDRYSSCDGLTFKGDCETDLMVWCDEEQGMNVRKEVDCAAYGQTCDRTGASDGGAVCVPWSGCGTVDWEGECDGNDLQFCDDTDNPDGELYIFDCGIDTCDDDGFFADCFIASTESCGIDNNYQGKCEQNSVVQCINGVETVENCDFSGTACGDDTESYSLCFVENDPIEDCDALCPNNHGCDNRGYCRPFDDVEVDEWTIMVYMVGNNNLSSSAWADINEMEQIGSPLATSVVVESKFSTFYGDTMVPQKYQGNTYRTRIVKDESAGTSASLDAAENLNDRNMSTTEELAEFIRWSAEKYPAMNYSLVLWDHGLGWQGGFTDGSNGSMTLKDLVKGVKDSGVRLDILQFDACMMGQLEVALAFDELTDYLIASEEVIPGAGLPYKNILQAIDEQNELDDDPFLADQLATLIVDEYKEEYETGSLAFLDRDVTLAAIELKTGGARDLNDAIGALYTELLPAETNPTFSDRQFISNMLSAQNSGIERYTKPEFADIKSIATLFETDLEAGDPAIAEAQNVKDILNDIIVQKAGDTSGGLSIYLPGKGYAGYGPSVSLDTYRSAVSELPLDPWVNFLAQLDTSYEETDSYEPSGGAVDRFRVLLSWGDDQDSTNSNIDLDLHVYEPSGQLATPSDGPVSANGLLSADSYATGYPEEWYELSEIHEPGVYIIVAHYNDTKDRDTYPTLQIYKDELAGGSQTLIRAEVVDQYLEYVPMNLESKLNGAITNDVLDDVINFNYSNVWYATTVEVK